MSDTRLANFRKTLAQQGLSAFYMRNESDIYWLCGFDDVFDGEGAFSLLVTPDQALLHTDSRYEIAARAAAQGSAFTVSTQRASHERVALQALGVVKVAEETRENTGETSRTAEASGEAVSASEAIAATTEEPPRLGVESTLTLGEFRALEKAAAPQPASATQPATAPQPASVTHPATSPASAPAPQPALTFQETHDLCVNLRAVKDATEIARLKAAQAITDAAFAHIIHYMRPGMTERQVQLELEHYMLCHGAAGLAFTSIVATGAHGASPHAVSNDTVLQAGQCVVMDFGARAQGYCSDMTRMVFLGQPSQQLRHAYSVLREANETVEALLAPGITGAQAHEKAEEILAAGGFAKKMGHGLGHGVGIDIHEQPNLSPKNTNPLVAGNVVTVEPGIYIAGEFGMRLEDFGVITDTGYQVFTQTSHEMVII